MKQTSSPQSRQLHRPNELYQPQTCTCTHNIALEQTQLITIIISTTVSTITCIRQSFKQLTTVKMQISETTTGFRTNTLAYIFINSTTYSHTPASASRRQGAKNINNYNYVYMVSRKIIIIIIIYNKYSNHGFAKPSSYLSTHMYIYIHIYVYTWSIYI